MADFPLQIRMTWEMILLLALVAAAMVLFTFDWISADIVALGVLLSLTLTGLLTSREAFAGFASDAVLMTLGLLVMTGALTKTGAVALAGQLIQRYSRFGPLLTLATLLATVGLMSGFVSNTATTALFVPIATGLALSSQIPPSRWLMPVAFASILSSSITLISTSTNLIVSGLMDQLGLKPLSMFELTPVGIPIALAGFLYLILLGRHLIPQRDASSEWIERFGMRSYLSELIILPNSNLIGKTLSQSGLGHDLDITVIRVVRHRNDYLWPDDRLVLEAGDVLLVEGPREEVLKIKDTAGIEIKADAKFSEGSLTHGQLVLVEALVVPGSPLENASLRKIRLRERFDVQVLGLNRHGRNLLAKLSRIALKVGDVLLIQGEKQNLAQLESERVVSILGTVNQERPDRPKALRAGIIFAASLLLAVTGIMPLPVAVLLGAFAVLASRCVEAEVAYREVEWRAIMLMACMLGLGAAMEKTGTAQFLAEQLSHFVQDLDPRWLLSGFFVLTTLLTQPMSNQAAAAVVLPIAIQTANQLQLNPRPFAIMICVAASCSFLTPLEPSCLLVYGPGRYRFTDFFRVGAPLVLIIFALALLLVPRGWPLTPAQP